MLRAVIVVLVVLGVAMAVLVGLQYLPDAPPVPALHRLVVRPTDHDANPSTALAVPITNGVQVLRVPIDGVARASLQDSWGDPRDNGKRLHHGTDIAAPANTPALAVASGTVEKMRVSATGGTTLYIRSSTRGWTYYYAHLSGYAPGLHEGETVAAGTLLGYVGDTGNAGAGNYHLHFGLTRTTPEQHWYQGEDVDPYPYLAGKPLPG